MSPRSSRTRSASAGTLLVCLAGIVWGSAPIAFDVVHDRTGLGAIAISALRISMGALVLTVAVVVMRQIGAVASAFRIRPLRVFVIGSGVAGYQALWFAAIPYVGASVATVLSLGLAPLLIIVWESWRRRRLPRRSRLAVLCVALVGLLLVTLPAAAHEGASPAVGVGLLLAVASGVLFAITTVIARSAATVIAALPLSAATTIAGAICLLPIAAISGPLITMDPQALAAIGYLGIVTMALASLMLFRGLRTATASTAAVATLLEPATATVLAVLVLQEPLTLPSVVGIVLILGAVAALSLLRQDTDPAPNGHFDLSARQP